MGKVLLRWSSLAKIISPACWCISELGYVSEFRCVRGCEIGCYYRECVVSCVRG